MADVVWVSRRDSSFREFPPASAQLAVVLPFFGDLTVWIRKPGAKGCVQDDDLGPLYEDLKAADALLIASPVYWFTMSAQAKIFMDRLYVFGAKGYRELKGKKIGVILTSGDADPRSSGAVNAMSAFKDAFAYLGAPIVGMLHGAGGKPGAVLKNKALLIRET